MDRGYASHGVEGETQVLLPGSGKRGSPGRGKGSKNRVGKRSSIEAVISHLKHAHGLSRNYLKGEISDAMNGLLSGMDCNVKLLMNEL